MKKEKKEIDRHISILTGEYVNLHYEHAPAGTRIAAVVIDWIVLGILYYLFLVFIDSLGRYIPWEIREYIYFVIILFIQAFNFLCEYLFNGQTIGKKIFKIKVISEECTPPDFLQCFMRWLLFLVDFFVGIFFIAKRYQRLADLASGCYVVYANDYSETNVNIDKDFPYIDENYKVLYPCAGELKQSEIISIQKVLYNKRYKGIQKEMCKRIRKRFPDVKFWGDDKMWLKQLVMDYHFLRDKKL